MSGEGGRPPVVRTADGIRVTTGRRKVVAIAAALLLVVVVAAVASQSNRPSVVYPPIYPPFVCVGELAVRLVNDNMFAPISYVLAVPPAHETSADWERGSLAAGDAVDFRYDAVCGEYPISVSWNGGPWEAQNVPIEEGKTSPVLFVYG